MAFRHFSIHRISNNAIIEENEIDRQVCDKFKLKHSDEDYGHFLFTESEAENFHQESISWVALLDWIVYHSLSLIGSCKRTNFEIEAALAWTRQYVSMPKSTVEFLSDLLKFFKEKGYYVYVYGHSVDKEEDCFHNLYRGEIALESESGLFLCSNNGHLKRFFPAAENLLAKPLPREYYSNDYYNICIHSLIIPEGVTSLERDFFSRGFVKDQVHFPNTLVSLGDKWNPSVFSNSYLPDIVIPEDVSCIGEFAFANSTIKSVRFTRIFECENLRQFNGAHIEKLYLPIDCHRQWQQSFDGYAFLPETNDVEFY